MIHILNWLFRRILWFTIGVAILGCLELLAFIFWEKKFMELYDEIGNLILGKDEN